MVTLTRIPPIRGADPARPAPRSNMGVKCAKHSVTDNSVAAGRRCQLRATDGLPSCCSRQLQGPRERIGHGHGHGHVYGGPGLGWPLRTPDLPHSPEDAMFSRGLPQHAKRMRAAMTTDNELVLTPPAPVP